MVALDIPLFYYYIGNASLNNEEPNKSEQENGDKSSDEIDETIFDQYLRKLDDENLTEEELKAMPEKIKRSLEIELKSKLSDLLGYPIHEIEFETRRGFLSDDSIESVIINHEIELPYGRSDTFVFKYQEQSKEESIDQTIAGGIVNMDIMNDLEESVKNGENINERDFKFKCKHASDVGNRILKSEFKRDDHGRITTTRPKDKETNGNATNDAKTTYVSRDDDDDNAR